MTEPPLPPNDLEAESFVIGAMLYGNTKMIDGICTDVRLAADHFYRPAHRAIYQAILDIHARGDTVDFKLVAVELEKILGPLDTSARVQIEMLNGSVPALGNYKQYAVRVKEKAVWRARLTETHDKYAAISAEDEVAYAAAAVPEDVQLAGHDGLLTPELLADRWVDWYDRSDSNVITTPWPTITDAMFGGFRPGDTTVITGWPGMGKSSGGDQQLEHAVEKHEAICCAYVNEMSDVDRVSRLLAGRSGVGFRRIMERKLSPEDARKVLQEAPKLPFAIQPCSGWGVDMIAAHMRKHRWDMSFLDLATRIPAHKTADWDYISGALADAARQANTHLLLAVQLNRERNTSAARPMPVLRDLRNTGAWEQDHRNVLIFHRREEYDSEKEVPVLHDDGVIQLAKVNNGQQGAVERVYLNYSKMRWDLLATETQRQSDKEFWSR